MKSIDKPFFAQKNPRKIEEEVATDVFSVGLVLSFGPPQKRAVTVPEALIQMLEKVAEKTNRARIITKVRPSRWNR